MKIFYTLSLVLLLYVTNSPALAVHECGELMGSCLPQMVLSSEPQPLVMVEAAPEPAEPVNPWNPPPDEYDPTEQDELNYSEAPFNPIDKALEEADAAQFSGRYADALEILTPLAEQGNPIAQENLARMYLNGRGVPQNDSEAARWMRKAADQGFAQAQYLLGALYDDGRGVPQSKSESLKWMRRAAEQDHPAAQYDLAVSYSLGKGLPVDWERAAHWLRKAAERGHGPAQYYIGIFYQDGKGVEKDLVEAIKWFRVAAEKGLAPAQLQLGLALRERANFAQSVKRMLGLNASQYNLRALGSLAPPNEAAAATIEAMIWLKVAARAGEARAYWALGTIYGDSPDVAMDFTEAYVWLTRAWEVSKDSTNRGNIEGLLKLILDHRMKPWHIAMAESQARQLGVKALYPQTQVNVVIDRTHPDPDQLFSLRIADSPGTTYRVWGTSDLFAVLKETKPDAFMQGGSGVMFEIETEEPLPNGNVKRIQQVVEWRCASGVVALGHGFVSNDCDQAGPGNKTDWSGASLNLELTPFGELVDLSAETGNLAVEDLVEQNFEELVGRGISSPFLPKTAISVGERWDGGSGFIDLAGFGRLTFSRQLELTRILEASDEQYAEITLRGTEVTLESKEDRSAELRLNRSDVVGTIIFSFTNQRVVAQTFHYQADFDGQDPKKGDEKINLSIQFRAAEE